jgi:hypothetical protein
MSHIKTNTLTSADMPMNSRAKGAPRKFRGSYKDVDLFLEEYDLLLRKCQVTSNQEKCKFLQRYCATAVWDVIEGLDSYYRHNWDHLKDDIRNLYNADHVKHCYTEKDLHDYVCSARKKQIQDLPDFRKYQQRYVHIAGWLKEHQKIEDIQMNCFFWKGLPSLLKPRIKREQQVRYPYWKPSEVIKMEKVTAIAEDLFCMDRFDADDSDYKDNTEKTDGELMASTADSSDDNKEYKKKKKQKQKRESVKRKAQKDKDSNNSTSEESKCKTTMQTKVCFEWTQRGRDKRRRTCERKRGHSQTPMRSVKRRQWQTLQHFGHLQ